MFLHCKMSLIDSCLLNENFSVESKNLLLTCAMNLNIMDTKYKPLDIIIFKLMLDNKINITKQNYMQFIMHVLPYVFLICFHIFFLFIIYTSA